MKKLLSTVLSALLLCSVMTTAPRSTYCADIGDISSSSEDAAPPELSEDDEPDEPLPPVLRDIISGWGDCG